MHTLVCWENDKKIIWFGAGPGCLAEFKSLLKTVFMEVFQENVKSKCDVKLTREHFIF